MNARGDERGQAIVFSVVALAVLLGMGALVLDVGSWFRADRNLQKTADAAALAGAQALPYDPAGASGLAQQYAAKNGDAAGPSNVSFSSSIVPNDTIKVSLTKPAPGFFAKIFGIESVTVGAKASARAASLTAARYVAPIAVRNTHPRLADPGCPCFNDPTTLPLGKTGAPGAFSLVNVDGSKGGTGPPILADWILNGYGGYLGLGSYLSDPGAKWNSSHVQSAMSARIGSELLFPVYDTLTGNGANAQYHIIGWVGFHLTGFDARGNSGSIGGWFTQVIWDGIQSTSGGGQPDLGVRAIELTE